LINCAGRAYPHYFEDITHAQFDNTMKTNLYGIWNTVSALVPHMKKKGGTIVNVSSLAGFIGVFGYTDYAASKFAVVGFSEALRSELRQCNISVALLCPPDTDTPGFATENLTKPEETRVLSKNTKVMQPDDVAREMIRGIRRETFLIIPCLDGKIVCFMKRHFPALVDSVMSREIAKVQRKKTCGRCR
ncbi:MAG TPA: SDR family NAD(P)-dependent oxidoreductase, partial [Deltaproteobacteria bacterium]|nr:SDR family NAD(P)-dependent oxidoreductase [Deltaproteobacteria bacterium]